MSVTSKQLKEFNSYTILAVLLSFLAALLLALNFIVLYVQLKESAYSVNGYYITQLEEFPVFCENLSLSPSEDYETFNVQINNLKYFLFENRYVCRLRNLTGVAEKTVERHSRIRFSKGLTEKPYLQCGNETLREVSGTLSAAFVKIAKHQEFNADKTDVIIHWDKHRENAYISEDLHYTNGDLKIPETRVYFVYITVLINGSCADSRQANVCNYYVRICARDRWSERTLLHKKGVYSSTDETFVTSLHVGGHVLLRRDDSVYVRVSEGSRLIPESVGNVFGITPIRNLQQKDNDSDN